MGRRLVGRRRRGNKWTAYVDTPAGQITKTFAIDTPQDEIDAWRADQIKTHGLQVPAAESLAAAVATYERRRASLPTLKQRLAHLAIWRHELGGARSLRSVTSGEIETILESWAAAGLAPATVKKRRTALQSLFVALFGKRGFNPVRATPIPKEPKAEARQIPRDAIERAIAAMPRYRSTKPGAPPVLSLAPLRAQVLATTGLPPGLLKRVQPHDLVLVAPCSVRVGGRHKGGGVEARTIPLTAAGADAFRAFHAAQAYGPFATQSLNRAFQKGCKAAGLDPRAVHLYDLRHSFLTDLYRATRDLATVARFALHAADSKMTARYAQGANRDVDQAAAAALDATWQTSRRGALKTAPKPVRARSKPRSILSRKPVKRRKLRLIS